MKQNSAVTEWIAGEFKRYKALAEAALAQLSDDEIVAVGAGGGNSVAVICWHIAGNLNSRFKDFLTSDGEKPWRKREEEFQPRAVTRAELLDHWERGWTALMETLEALNDGDLARSVTIRGQSLPVGEALQRGIAHTAYHVGQVVYVARAIRGASWHYLSIPPGQSEAYNAAPGSETASDHAARLRT